MYKFNPEYKYGYPEEIWYSLEDLPNEQWKDVLDTNNRYKISNYGRLLINVRTYIDTLKRNCSRRARIGNPSINSQGYLHFTICYKERRFSEKIHRIVGKYFLPKSINKIDINHKDGNKRNNHISNLEWTTSKENYHHSRDVLGFHIEKRVWKLDKKTNRKLEIFDSAKKAAASIGVGRSQIYRVCSGWRKSCKGFKWIYENE